MKRNGNAKRSARRFWQTGLALLSILLAAAPSMLFADESHTVLLEAESFDDYGGWVNDTQVMDQMGSPYLMAHGLGRAVEDAKTDVEFPAPGTYRVLVRTRDWAAPWDAPASPGRFEVHVDGTALETVFGTAGAEWHWQDGGRIEIGAANQKVEVALRDLTGFNGRCDAIVFTTDPDFAPPNEGKAMARFRREMLGHPEDPENSGPYDLVVVGGGMAGTCTAVSAARQGLTVALIQDRPVLGGNNSSEVRVGQSGKIHLEPYPRLGYLVDEIGPIGYWAYRAAKQNPDLPRSREVLATIERHPEKRKHNAGPATNYEDDKKLEAVQAEENISLFLNTRVNAVEMNGSRIAAVAGQNTRTGRRTRFTGRWFADCTGDGNLGYLAGADYRYGRESRAETGEPLAPEESDNLVMGTSVQWYSRQTDEPTGFPETPWAIQFTDETYQKVTSGDWDWETGFRLDQISEFEKVRDNGLRAVFGNWSFLKNHAPDKSRYAKRELEWVAYIGGKRESRRLLGDVILKQQDIQGRRDFPDAAVTATWSIDLHYPTDFQKKHFAGEEFQSRADTVRIRPYPIPYRCFYSRNMDNLFMAGRHISVTHVALGTVRVMRTLGMVGEVVGMAAAVCDRHGVDPRQVYTDHLDELKELMSAGVPAPQYLAGANLAQEAEVNVSSSLDPEQYPASHINDGDDSTAGNANRWISADSMPDTIELVWDQPREISAARIVSGFLTPRNLPSDPIDTFVLQYHDGTEYRDIESTATSDNVTTDWRRQFDPVTTDRIRLLVTVTPGDHTRIWELEVMNSDGSQQGSPPESLPQEENAMPPELKSPNYRISKLEGIGYDDEFGRQDPSNVIKVGDTYHVYTSKFTGNTPYSGVIGHATSTDGIHWKEGDNALAEGPPDAWDNYGVLTPYIMAYEGKYYLYYTASRCPPGEQWSIRGPNNGRHIGMATADTPYGPWKKHPEPILSPGRQGEWDSYLVDDAHLIVRNGEFWLYYKGGDMEVTGDTTQWGLAVGDSPAGPFVKAEDNPLIGGHTVCVWPHREGIAALIDNAGPEKHTVQWSADGIHFRRAAKLNKVHTGCGPYDPDAFTNTEYGSGIRWGVAQDHRKGRMCIVRFDVDLKVPREARAERDAGD